jgi:hypothetical protein
LPPGPFGVAAGANGIVDTTSFDTGSVIVTDTATASPIRVPIAPRNVLAVDKDAHRLYVSDGAGMVSVIDTTTRATVGNPITLPG